MHTDSECLLEPSVCSGKKARVFSLPWLVHREEPIRENSGKRISPAASSFTLKEDKQEVSLSAPPPPPNHWAVLPLKLAAVIGVSFCIGHKKTLAND